MLHIIKRCQNTLINQNCMAYFRIVVVWHPDVKIPFNLKHNRKIFKIQNNIYYKEESLYLERFIYRLW